NAAILLSLLDPPLKTQANPNFIYPPQQPKIYPKSVGGFGWSEGYFRLVGLLTYTIGKLRRPNRQPVDEIKDNPLARRTLRSFTRISGRAILCSSGLCRRLAAFGRRFQPFRSCGGR